MNSPEREPRQLKPGPLPEWTKASVEQAIESAKQRVHQECNCPDTQRRAGKLVQGMLLLAAAPLAYFARDTGTLAILGAALFSVTGGIHLWQYVHDRPTTPQYCFARFVAAVNERKFDALWALIAPTTAGFLTPTQETLAEYWAEFFRVNVHKNAVIQLKHSGVYLHSPKVAVVAGQVVMGGSRVRPGLLLLGILGFVVLLICLIVTIPKKFAVYALFGGMGAGVLFLISIIRPGGKPQYFDFQKIVLRCGDEWRLLSGEWIAREEHDVTWLTGTK
jgi:hypothetical protein